MTEKHNKGPLPEHLLEADRLLSLGYKLVKLVPFTKRPQGDAWNHPSNYATAIDPDATGYGYPLAVNKLVSIDPDNVELARVGLAACGFDLDAQMAHGVRTISTRPGSGGRSTFQIDDRLAWVSFTSRDIGAVLELRADSTNLQDCVAGVQYRDKEGNDCTQKYANGKSLMTVDEMPSLREDFAEWWARCSTDLAFKHEQQVTFFAAIAEHLNREVRAVRSLSARKQGTGTELAFPAKGVRGPFNEHVRVEDMLAEHGYVQDASTGRWSAPNATGAPGVRPVPGKDDLWRSDHASDPLCGTFDAWIAFVVLEHGGDLDAALAQARTFDFMQKRDYSDLKAGGKAAHQAPPRKEPLKSVPASQFAAAIPTPEYLVDGIFQRGYFYTVTGPTGVGKTAVAKQVALALALGIDFAGHECIAGPVLYCAVENPDDIRARLLAAAQELHIEVSDLDANLHFIDQSFTMKADGAALIKEVERVGAVAVIVDTDQATSGSDDENNNSERIEHAKRLRRVTKASTRPLVLDLCHPPLGASKDNNRPRGGSSFLAEVDGNVGLWRDDEDSPVALYKTPKFRGAPFAEMLFNLPVIEVRSLLDSRGRPVRSVVAKVASMEDSLNAESDHHRKLVTLLRDCNNHPEDGQRHRAHRLGWKQQSEVSRALGELKERGLVKTTSAPIEVTPRGKRMVLANAPGGAGK